MTTTSDRGRFVWYDLMTPDPQAAVDFYTRLIGWSTREWQGGDQPYTMWVNSDSPLGGVMDFPPEAAARGVPPHWLAYVAVEDLAATARRVADLGGEVHHPPTDIPGAGSFAVIGDPQGAVIAIYGSQSDGSAPEGPPQVGQFSWHELATTDHGAACTFYSDLFGWEKQDAIDMGGGWIYQMYGRKGMPLGGMFNKTAEMPGPPMWLYYIRVDDVDRAVERVKELGGTLVNGPMEVPGGDRIAQCTDPQGAFFALHSSAS